MYQITIDLEKCDGCEECIDICPMDVLILNDGKAAVENLDDCEGCESCMESCPNSAIVVVEM